MRSFNRLLAPSYLHHNFQSLLHNISNMAIRSGVPALMLLLAAALFLHHAAHAQVTFSRDWTAGKRSLGAPGGPECSANIKSTVALCQMLVSELRQLATCEVRAQLLGRDEDMMDSAQAFPTGSHSGR